MSSSTNDFVDLDFGGSIRDVVNGLVLKPLLHNYLYDATFPEFDLHFRKQEMERAPDDFFHPSTHPLWTPQALYRWLAYPDTFPADRKQYMSTLAVMFGKVWHEFVQMCLTDAGVLPAEWQKCEMCPPKVKCNEAGFLDGDLGERGHTDGLLDLTGIGPHINADLATPVLELKTANDNFGRLNKIDDLDLEAFKKKWPDYYAQVQRYMRAFKRTMTVVLMIEPTYPYVMREFHIPIDRAFNQMVDVKYVAVRQAVETSQEPFCCRAKGCPAARLCGV